MTSQDHHATSRSLYTATTNKSSAVAEMGDRLATTDMGRKVGVAVPLSQVKQRFWGKLTCWATTTKLYADKTSMVNAKTDENQTRSKLTINLNT